MPADNIWFPFYIGDYLADTMHLDHRRHGVYVFLLCGYYKNRGPLDDDNSTLSAIVRLPLSEWLIERPVMAKFFQIRDGKWHQKRADMEILKRSQRQESGRRGAESRWDEDSKPDGKGHGKQDGKIMEVITHNSQPQSEPQPKPKSDPESLSSGKPDNAEMAILTQARIVLHYLNEKAARHYREVAANLLFIKQRLEEPDVTIEGMKVMIDRQVARWKGTDYDKYLRPQTLFNRSKFADYYDNRDMPVDNPKRAERQQLQETIEVKSL